MSVGKVAANNIHYGSHEWTVQQNMRTYNSQSKRLMRGQKSKNNQLQNFGAESQIGALTLVLCTSVSLSPSPPSIPLPCAGSAFPQGLNEALHRRHIPTSNTNQAHGPLTL